MAYIKRFENKEVESKSVLVITGVHGNEVTPLETGIRLINNPHFRKKISKLTIINGINYSGIKNNSREIFYNRTDDLNRVFSEDEDYISLLKNEISQHDIVFDIHSSPDCSEFLLVDIDDKMNSICNFIENIDPKINYACRYSVGDTIKNYVNSFPDKIGFTLELNGVDKIDLQSAQNGASIVQRIIYNMDKLNISKESFETNEIKNELFQIKVPFDGLFYPDYYDNRVYKKDEPLGHIVDFFGNSKCIIKAPCDLKIICGIPQEPFFVSKGQAIAEYIKR